MAQISDRIIADIKAALDDLGDTRQGLADRIASDYGPEVGAAIIRLLIAADQATVVAGRPQTAAQFGRYACVDGHRNPAARF